MSLHKGFGILASSVMRQSYNSFPEYAASYTPLTSQNWKSQLNHRITKLIEVRRELSRCLFQSFCSSWISQNRLPRKNNICREILHSAVKEKFSPLWKPLLKKGNMASSDFLTCKHQHRNQFIFSSPLKSSKNILSTPSTNLVKSQDCASLTEDD